MKKHTVWFILDIVISEFQELMFDWDAKILTSLSNNSNKWPKFEYIIKERFHEGIRYLYSQDIKFNALSVEDFVRNIDFTIPSEI